jgi:hypothetical protein
VHRKFRKKKEQSRTFLKPLAARETLLELLGGDYTFNLEGFAAAKDEGIDVSILRRHSAV